jgi:hypothetical protein
MRKSQGIVEGRQNEENDYRKKIKDMQRVGTDRKLVPVTKRKM